MFDYRHSIAVALLLCCCAVTACAQTATPSSPRRTPDQPLPELFTGKDPVEAAGLVVGTNAACELRVNGQSLPPVLMPGEPRTVNVVPGESNIECASTTVTEAVVKRTVPIGAAGPHSAMLDLATLVVKASCSGKAATLANLGHGVLRHCVTGADWTQSDSGKGGMEWAPARAYCAKRGAGWVLPTPDELAELIDRTGKSQTPCGIHTCNISPHFKLTSPIFWTDMITGPTMIMIVNLILGGRHPTAEDANYDYHALCVKRATS